MDGNNPTRETPAPNIPPPQPTPPVAPQVTVPGVSSGGSNGSNKILMWFIIGLIIVVLAVGGIYFFLSKQPTPTPIPTPQPATTTTEASPAPAITAGLENDLNNINVDETGTNTDFAPVDQDLQQL